MNTKLKEPSYIFIGKGHILNQILQSTLLKLSGKVPDSPKGLSYFTGNLSAARKRGLYIEVCAGCFVIDENQLDEWSKLQEK